MPMVRFGPLFSLLCYVGGCYYLRQQICMAFVLFPREYFQDPGEVHGDNNIEGELESHSDNIHHDRRNRREEDEG